MAITALAVFSLNKVSLTMHCFELRLVIRVNELHGCLPCTRGDRLVHILSKWNGKTVDGSPKLDLVCCIYRNLLGRPGTELSSLRMVDRANGKNTFRWEIPFGNFGLPFKKSRFPMEISVLEENNGLSIYIPSGIFE